MKHSKVLLITLYLSVIMLSSIMASETTVQKSEEASESNCGDPCQGKLKIIVLECQRTVYQMKFQGLADCEGACRGTVNKK
jgi:hypothetical protein